MPSYRIAVIPGDNIGPEVVEEGRHDVACRGRKRVASATKSNALHHSMGFWDDNFAEVAKEYPDVETAQYYVDAMSMYVINRPWSFDVIVASNLFGGINSNEASAVVGSIGLAAGGNINPEREFPSMFEPIHGSAPDIAGKGIANPVAAIGAIEMLLDHVGERAAASYER